MENLIETIFQALASEYWKPCGYGYSTYRMAEAAAKAAGHPDANLKQLEAIIVRNLQKPNFTVMAKELAEILQGDFTVNGYRFSIGQIPYGEYEGKWVWSTTKDESEPFDEAWQAQADTIRHVRQMRDDEDKERMQAAETARYGNYQQQHWHDGRA